MGCWRNKFLQRRSSNFKEDKHLTVDEMIDALESVLGALYQQQDYTRFPEILTAAKNITGALSYDFAAVMPDYPNIPFGEHER